MTTTVPAAFDLTGHVALVTGSSSDLGIGFAAARLLGQLGASVMVTGTTDRVGERASELQREGIAAGSHVADLMDPGAAQGLVAATEAEFGKVDIVVNNAGLASVNIPERPNPLMSMTEEEWSLALRRNVDSAFFVTRAALPGMVHRGYGRIVNVGSSAGVLTAYTGDVGYHTAKAAMLGMTRSVAVDVAGNGVTANIVLPGWIATAAQLPSEVPLGDATPVGRSASAAEVATGIAFLAAPGASYVTGTTLVIDGGNSISS
ncbi:short-chain dehydrogenase [Mycobacterium antarcticum]|uniref:SDR family NAD(P)-dependent oxidoreductase n=1 Tax=unclassified Mycolicibacterium TaxID=2636767 RepID=UPI00238862F0|nr:MULTISPECIES: SDR family NAD(P)-dependent oxidoreductase [unclassified Mycolicibacterium]BDX33741.1 short-chain dehydrogenase [Mycolicibacterium sp. TUM20985]GLP76909.1 short-chain dehydrogenase [Mycolicibacterium sp. TUM20983]GLP82670.1 short-chain dehydrogenase [Mycolicibacterium sp. TUM20984]